MLRGRRPLLVGFVAVACAAGPPAAPAAQTVDAGPPPDPPAGPRTGGARGCRGQPVPLEQHWVPPGLCAGVVAVGPATNPRQLTFAPNGDLFVVNASAIWLLRDEDGDGYFEPREAHEWAKTGGNGNNCHVDVAGGFLYAGTPDGVKRWPYVAGATSAAGPGEDVVVGQPSGDGHGFHTVHVYDGFLYVHSGSPMNAANPPESRATYDGVRSLLRRFPLAPSGSAPLAWTSGEIVTVGLRNMVGYTRAASGRMFGVVNGIDDLEYRGEYVAHDNPGEQVVELGMGRAYGFPFCFTAQRVVRDGSLVRPGTQLHNPLSLAHDDAWCAAHSLEPATFLQAHSAPLDIVFFGQEPGGALPERWRGGAFVSLHGSWNRSTPTGFKVVWIPFDAEGRTPMPSSTATTTTFPHEVVFGKRGAAGPEDGAWSWLADGRGEAVRPVGVAISPVDGALYVSSGPGAGYIYRVALGS